MGNIASVSVAITTGGAGTIFWAWAAWAVGMATIFFYLHTCLHVPKKNEDGIERGGLIYFIEAGRGKRFRPLAIMFAFCGMFCCLVLFQSNQLASLFDQHWTIKQGFTSVITMIIVDTVILVGITRVRRCDIDNCASHVFILCRFLLIRNIYAL